MELKQTEEQDAYWSRRYAEKKTGWDIGYPSTPIKTYIDQLTDKSIKILIPGAGNAYEAEYLFQQGFKNLYVMDISEMPLAAFSNRIPEFPASQILHENFFEHKGKYDLIIEQTFFCSFIPTPSNRNNYAKQMHQLLEPEGRLVGLWFDFPLQEDWTKRPFGGSKAEYLSYLQPLFHVHVFEKAYNSIKPRMGNELFGIFRKKEKLDLG